MLIGHRFMTQSAWEFSPNIHVVKRCLHGMAIQEKGKSEEAGRFCRPRYRANASTMW